MSIKNGFTSLKYGTTWKKLLSSFKIPDIFSWEIRKNSRFTFNNKKKSIKLKLTYLYGKEKGNNAFIRIEEKIDLFLKEKPKKLKNRDKSFDPLNRFTQKDILLITYPESVFKKKLSPLKAFNIFSRKYLKKYFNTLHILPFYPSTSDKGFSIKNYKRVDESFGEWNDINSISQDFNLMFDCVFNHISSKSKWFREFLKGNEIYKNHFITFNGKNEISADDLKKIVRPRTSELLTEFKSKNGPVFAWTTFSKDQVDLNYHEPVVLLRIIDIIFRYIKNGATILRLDAVNYLWKEFGTSCIHLKQNHILIQLLRDILDIAAPSISIVTETNVPHAYNIRYFGNGKNEAQMVYNFTLPPLLLYSFYKGDTKYFSRWADRLENISKYSSYLNFLSSHDGIGITPAERVLPQKEVKFMIKEARKNGSLVSYKSKGTEKSVPYEINTTWWSALNSDSKNECEELQIKRFLASYVVMMSLKGVPAIYFPSLFGLKNDYDSVKKSKYNRDINRKNFCLGSIKKFFSKNTRESKVFKGITSLLKIRAENTPFHPGAKETILLKNDSVFSALRTSPDKKEKILALVNITDKAQSYTVNCKESGITSKEMNDLISGQKIILHSKNLKINEFDISLSPYQALWLKSYN